MGLNKQTTTKNAVYLFQGKMITPATEKSSTTIEKNGKIYETHKSLEGRISDIKVVDGYQDQKDLLISVNDAENETYHLQFAINSGYFKSFSRMFKNVDTTRTLELFPTYKEDDGKSKTGMVILQNGDWVKRFYTYENMGECPVAMPVEVNGIVTYDYSKQNEFLISEILAKFEEEKLPF